MSNISIKICTNIIEKHILIVDTEFRTKNELNISTKLFKQILCLINFNLR